MQTNLKFSMLKKILSEDSPFFFFKQNKQLLGRKVTSVECVFRVQTRLADVSSCALWSFSSWNLYVVTPFTQ